MTILISDDNYTLTIVDTKQITTEAGTFNRQIPIQFNDYDDISKLKKAVDTVFYKHFDEPVIQKDK